MIDALSSLSATLRGGPARRTSSVHGAALPATPARRRADFGAMLGAGRQRRHADDEGRRSRRRSRALQGKASVQQVVEAVMSAERQLQTAIAVRDKVVAAYLEISRMAI